MPELTPDETAALAHWSSFGRPGEPPTARYVPGDPSRFEKFGVPESAVWNDVFTEEQTRVLLWGFEPEAMEDKWVVYSDDVSASGATSIHFIRSWTGIPVVQVDLQLTDSGSRITKATWEADPARINGTSEQFARDTFLECCRWVLGMKPAD